MINGISCSKYLTLYSLAILIVVPIGSEQQYFMICTPVGKKGEFFKSVTYNRNRKKAMKTPPLCEDNSDVTKPTSNQPVSVVLAPVLRPILYLFRENHNVKTLVASLVGLLLYVYQYEQIPIRYPIE